MVDVIDIDGYQIVQKIGSGGYGEIYTVKKGLDPLVYALKTENIESLQKSMKQEIEIIKELPNLPCFPQLLSYGTTGAINYFVMPLYGPSIQSIKSNFEPRTFSLSTSFRIAKEMLIIIEKLHKSGFVHCDIKPSNFLLQHYLIGGLVLADFGLSSKYIDEKTGKHIENKSSDGFRGTLKYASINVHKLIEPTRRDDIISWFYSLIEMAKGYLPWNDVRDKNLSLSCKQAISSEKLCQSLPNLTIFIWNLIKDLDFDQEPHYKEIYELIDSICLTNSWNFDDPYDWELQPQIIHQLSPNPELFDPNLNKIHHRSNYKDSNCCCKI